jgi:hypothetical protein
MSAPSAKALGTAEKAKIINIPPNKILIRDIREDQNGP